MGFKYDKNYFSKVNPNIEGNKSLREPQIQGYYHVYNHFKIRKKSSHAIVILPTGVGKTGLMALLPYNISSGRVLIIAPQIVIKDTVIEELDSCSPGNFWTKRNVISNPKKLPAVIEFEGSKTKQEVLEAANIVVINAQKLQGRLQSSPLNFLPKDFFDMIIIDEAHHSTARTWVETTQHFSDAKVVKVTGTPFRTDKKEIAGELVYEYKLSQAMSRGFVKSLENLEYVPGDLYLTLDKDNNKKYTVEQIKSMGLKDEDWISRSVAYSAECSEKVVEKSIELLEYKLRNNNPVPHKIIAVACSIWHAEQIRNMYEERGYSATVIHSDLSDFEKAKAKSDIKNHRVKVVVNVAMLGEGYDHIYLSVAAIFRPFRNELPYAQFIGRILRFIPENEATRTDDNIGQIVSHKYLDMQKLWRFYKIQIEESEIIKHLRDVDILENESENTSSGTKDIKHNDIGSVHEIGNGTLIGDTYLTTELIKKRKEEENQLEKKVKEIQKLLNINREKAIEIISSADGNNSSIKRPDQYFASKRKDIDTRIKESIVPELITKFKINQKDNNLKNCILFRNRRYSWIATRIKDNGGLLAVYFSQYLNNEIGLKRDDWSIDDYERADEKLPECIEYVEKVLADYLNIDLSVI
ncbi:DEAD/DEAH box helicase [Clostridium novyi]|uniref:DEAD/DEAH box helicase n=1 Tax=Clostridium novyi TaxID=1542 RepID=UPI0004D42C6C|nr:DEAD/DEAH box helicase family protein [Clostridium novyi]KEH84724.1 type III restriction protein res subunit [Clostridium novyi A str. BKT29909]